MARSTRRVEWAGVEFQPDLRSPLKPVRLGVILVEMTPKFRSVVVIGRAPNRDHRPEEFQKAGDLIMKVAATWIDSVFKDATEASHENIFPHLTERWKWNLYLIQPKIMSVSDMEGVGIESLAKKAFVKFVGAPFREAAPTRAPSRRGDALPIPAWLLEEVKRQKLGHMRDT